MREQNPSVLGCYIEQELLLYKCEDSKNNEYKSFYIEQSQVTEPEGFSFNVFSEVGYLQSRTAR